MSSYGNPAQDYIERQLDLNEFCIQRPAATFFIRVAGDSMIEAGVYHGDILVVDRSVTPIAGDIVVASIHNELTVKELELKPRPRLIPRNARYPAIELTDEIAAVIFGVATSVVRRLRRG